MDLKKITGAVCGIAERTGLYLKKERETFSLDKVEQKSDHDYVSYVDKAAEEQIVASLKALLPEAGFITEEGTVEQSETTLNWVIDPLDGTTNYIQDYAPYCVSIALQEGEDLLVGVVYEVCRDECFYAWKGGGAYMNKKQIRVSDKCMEKALIGLDAPYNAGTYKPVILNVVDKLYGKVSSLRMNGSAAMSLCYVAIGRYDGWAEAFINSWDYSAGALIIREAGGKVTDFNGNENLLGTHHVVATNGVIHDELREVFDVI
ncbi:MAG: inositol monophosphatase [Tannerella sp.]|jgi:myo-inositol-1(or 4)-monophosphatase|nr:inositol monophosphatase [Tannerella sp.]